MADITLSQIVALRNGLDPVLSQLQSLLSSAYLQSLPIVGTRIATAAANGEAALTKYQALEQDIAAALDALSNPGGYAATELTKAFNDAIAKAGFSGNAAVLVGADGTLSIGLHESATASYSQQLGADFGIPNLSVSTTGSAAASIGYAVDLSATVTAGGAFALASSATPALTVSLDAASPSFSADANVSALKFQAVDRGTSLHGSFALDTSGSATFSGDATLAVHLTSDLGSAALPSVQADLDGSWHFDNASIGASTFGDKPTIRFDNVSYDLGSFFQSFLKPVLDKIAPVLAPIHNALAVFNTDLSFLKGLLGPAWHTLDVAGATGADGHDAGDGKVTLLDVLKLGLKLSGHDQDVSGIASFLGTLDRIVNIAAYLDNVSLGPASYNLGSFAITDDIRSASFSAANAAINILAPGQNITTVLQGLGGAYAAQVGGGTTTNASALQAILSDPTIALPILNPANAFRMLLGGTTDLFTVSPPTVGLSLGSVDSNGAPTSTVGPLFTLPIFPGVSVDAKAALQASFGLGFGVDTKGLLEYSAGGFNDPAKLLDGLFVTNPSTGPVLRVAGDVGLYLDIGLPNTGIGGGGDIGGDIEFTLPGTGKTYLGPFLSTLASDPLSAFNAQGRITAGFDAGVEIAGVSLLSYDSPRVTLAGFNHVATPAAGPAPTVLQSLVVSAIDDNLALSTGTETPGHVIRFTATFSGAVAIPSDGPGLVFNDNGTTTINTTLTTQAGSNKVVFEYRVLPGDITLKTLRVQGVSGRLLDSGGHPIDLSAFVGSSFAGLDIDTSEPREFTAPTGDFNVQSSFNRQFVSVTAPGGQDLTLYGNAIIDSGSVASFHQDSADLTTLAVQAGATLAMGRGVLRVNGGLVDSDNRGTIQLGAATLQLKSQLHNHGTIAIGDVAGTPTLSFLLPTNTLDGGGTVVLSDSAANLIGGGPTVGDASRLPVLVNQDNTISGAGTIGGYAADGSTGLDLVNHAAITGSGTQALRLLATTVNTGTLSGTGSGGLLIAGTVDNIAGTITASGGGLVTLGDKADVTGGKLLTPGGNDTARIATAGLAALHGTVTLDADLQVGAGATLQVNGDIHQVHAANPADPNGTRLSAGSGTLELQTGAAVDSGYLTSGPGGRVRVTGTASIGSGALTDAAISVDAGADLALVRVSNRGVVQGAGHIALGDAIDNAGGTVAALAGGSVSLLSGARISGGTLTGAQGATPGTLMALGLVTLDGSAATLTNTGSLHATMQAGVTDRTQSLHLTGTINQYGAAQSGELVADDADVILDHADLQNGTLRTVGTGQFIVSSDSVLDGTSHGLTLPGAVSISHSTSLTLRGLILNTGSITEHGYSGYAETALLMSGHATLSGGGTLRLQNDYAAGQDAMFIGGKTDATDILDNADNLIVGYGRLGNGGLSLVNEATGTIDAVTGILAVDAGAGTIGNAGLMEATAGGTLRVVGTVDNRGGRLLAGDGATVELAYGSKAATVSGGRLETAGTGVVTADQGNLTLDGTVQAVTNAGRFVVTQGRTLTVRGTFTNTATTALNGYSGYGPLLFQAFGTVTLNGGGTVTLQDKYGAHGDTVHITGGSIADRLDNVDNTLVGYGELGSGALTLTNEAGGVIDATEAALVADTGSAAIANRGVMEATASGTLDVRSAVANTGTLLADATGTVVLRGTVDGSGAVKVAAGGKLVLNAGLLIGNGSVSVASGGVLAVTGLGGALDGTAQAVTLAGSTAVDHGAVLTASGAIGNSGTMSLDGYSGYATTLLRVSGTARLGGGGTVVLHDAYGAFGDTAHVTGTTTADRLDNVDNTVRGYGELGSGALSVINEAAGTIDATEARLLVDTGSAMIANAGLMEATASGTLDVRSAVANTGRILAGGTGTVRLHGAVSGSGAIDVAAGGVAVLNGGSAGSLQTVTVAAGGRMDVMGSGALDGTSRAVAVAGALVVRESTTLTLQGTVANTGALNVSGYSGYDAAVLMVSGAATLSGGGAVTLSDAYGARGDTSRIAGSGPADTLDNLDNVVSGYGELGSGGLTITNEAAGVIQAKDATLVTGSVAATTTNRGLMQATSGGTLRVLGRLDNRGGRLLAADGAVVQLSYYGQTATVSGGRLDTAGTGVVTANAGDLVLDGTTQAVTNAGRFVVTEGRTVTVHGTFTNTATTALNGYSGYGPLLFTVSGAATLNGGGTVTLQDNYGARGDTVHITGTTTADTLDNVDNTIRGYGELGGGALTFTNEAGGTVDATDGTLLVNTGGGGVVNRGLLLASTGTLVLNSATSNAGTVLANGGRVTVGAGDAGNLSGGTLTGGTWSARAGGTLAR